MGAHKCYNCDTTATIVSEKLYYCAGCYLTVFKLEKRLKKETVSRKRQSLKERLKSLSSNTSHIVTC